MSRAREGTVKNLQELYTVAVGVALVVAIEQIVREPGVEGAGINWSYLAAFFAFLSTLIPFYHGALRHLDQVYVEEGGRSVRTVALLADFILLFMEACLLLAAARVLGDVRATAWFITLLLAFDAVWGGAVYLVFTRGERRWAELRWVQINLVASPVLAIFLVFAPKTEPPRLNTPVAVVFLLICLVRSVLDYGLSWDFYFPWRRQHHDLPR